MRINRYIDYTNLKANATESDIKELCATAIKNNYYSVCVNPCYVSIAKKLLKGSNVKVATVIGFPLGMNTTDLKAYEAAEAVKNGADEVDMVINVGALKSHNRDYLLNEINAVKASGAITKVIIETCLLTEEEKVMISEIVRDSNADYIKTSTGFSTCGATVDDVKLLYNIVSAKGKKVKAAGGIRTFDVAKAMIEAGAERIGASKEL